MANENIIGNGLARPQGGTSSAQPSAIPAPAGHADNNALLRNELHQANTQLIALQQRLSDAENLNSQLQEQLQLLQAEPDGSLILAPVTLDQEQNQARIKELSQRLEDEMNQKHALASELESLQKARNQDLSNDPSQDSKRAATATEIATLKKEIDKLKEAKQDLQHRLVAQALNSSKAEPTGAPRRMVVNDAASPDIRLSYAIGAWYADSAPHETQKLASIGKKLDLQAFSQGFSDKIDQRLQLSSSIISVELANVDKLLEQAMLSKNEKQAQSVLAAAAAEKGAVKMPDGVVYKILNKGKAPMVSASSDILFELDEELGTGEILAARETKTSLTVDLPPLFQDIVKQLGIGGSARIHVPITQAHAVTGVPPGSVSITTIRIIGVK
ncbi:FKBP-type peptidyl-prolyl cis-trans isomerase N-terminal domain-containing protein [Alcaligenes phenolicus]|uniref:FKBP-type peptidyl-prolyl cis-trans isomerase N-terminal domain-containing protein n=1 Tax=Alcaligenes phenolicus TaxID=232846 RepID=UPI002AA806D5|nr:FKBP-type peptidyl-prolyl cis-trans isomerase N-terminal domain-containing protein [Alcaligenes phenolicus]